MFRNFNVKLLILIIITSNVLTQFEVDCNVYCFKLAHKLMNCMTVQNRIQLCHPFNLCFCFCSIEVNTVSSFEFWKQFVFSLVLYVL